MQTAFSVAYPVGDMILLAGLASVLLRRSPASSARSLQFLAAGLVFFVIADLAYGYISLHSTYHGGDPVGTLYVISLGLFAVAGAAQSSTRPGRELGLRPRQQRASWGAGGRRGCRLRAADHRSP